MFQLVQKQCVCPPGIIMDPRNLFGRHYVQTSRVPKRPYPGSYEGCTGTCTKNPLPAYNSQPEQKRKPARPYQNGWEMYGNNAPKSCCGGSAPTTTLQIPPYNAVFSNACCKKPEPRSSTPTPSKQMVQQQGYPNIKIVAGNCAKQTKRHFG